ncbi:MAG: hypothetical protein GTO63_07955 [Anaerolineae bacterium]|nr:hypothetical protein [Anaerolineae bacterium]NIN94863.1 hypothetical protein [Anaerolineae bacterium]NIQ77914.1 hypothetical protein [Anaerolineae bacterium]
MASLMGVGQAKEVQMAKRHLRKGKQAKKARQAKALENLEKRGQGQSDEAKTLRDRIGK